MTTTTPPTTRRPRPEGGKCGELTAAMIPMTALLIALARKTGR